MPRVKVLLGVAESPPGRPEVPAPVVTGHREGADRVQRAAGGPDPLIDGPVGRYEPVDFGGVIGRRDPYQVERVYQVSSGSRSSGLATAWLRNAESTTWPKGPRSAGVSLVNSPLTTDSTSASPTKVVSHGCG